MQSSVRSLLPAAVLLSTALVFPAASEARSDDTGAGAAAALLSAAPLTTGSIPSKEQPPAATTGKSGLPVPRFVSLKGGRTNVRIGPGESYAISWTFTRAALPVEVIAEFDTWRRVRDSDGSVGWVLQNLLSSKRTAVVAPWSDGGPKALRGSPMATAAVSAYLDAGVLADVGACHQNWCRLSGNGFSGWIEQDQLWGVYPGEEIP
jgi:SH3-like domain-containing protein